MNKNRKLSSTTLVISAVFFIAGASIAAPLTASAALTEPQIQSILALLQSFGADATVVNNVNSSLRGLPTSGGGGGGSQRWCHDFNRNLRVNDEGSEIQALHKALVKEGLLTDYYASDNFEGSSGFNENTASAITGFQEKYKDEILTPNGLSHGTGYVGSSTRRKLNQLYGCGVFPPPISTPNYDAGPSSPFIRGQSYDFSGKITNAIPNAIVYFFLQRPDGTLKYSDRPDQDILQKAPSHSTDINGNYSFSARQTVTNEGQNGIWTSWVTVGGIASNKRFHNVGNIQINRGSLYLSPSSLNVGVGQSAKIQALYQPPMPPCPPNFTCTLIMPTPYPVEATWVPSNTNIATVSYYSIPCPASVPSTNAGCWSFPTAVVSGVSAGNAEVKAIYTESSGNVITAVAPVNVTSVTQPSITVLSPNGGENWTRGTTRQISFNSAFPINIYLSPQNNLNGYYMVLATNVASPFNWAVGQPNVDNNPSGTSIADGKYYICISNRDTGQSDCSDAPFSIVTGTQTSATDSDNSPDYTFGASSYPITPQKYPDLFTAGVGRGNYIGSNTSCIYGTEPNPTSCKPTTESFTTYYDHCFSSTQLNEAFVNSSGKLGAYGVFPPAGYECRNGAFTSIQQSSITVLSPNGGEIIVAGTQLHGSWTMNYNPPSNLTVHLTNYTTGTEYYSAKLFGALGNNTFDTHPEATNAPAGQYRITICDENTPNPSVTFKPLCDTSDMPFSIVPTPKPTANRILGTFANDFKATSVTLGANVNVVESNSTLFLIYGTNPNLTNYSCGVGSGCIQTQGTAVNTSGTNTVYSFPINNLLPQTQYYFRAYINNNAGGVIESPVNLFMTPQSQSITGLTPNSSQTANLFDAILNLWWPSGSQKSCFQFGC